jgi:hypothetical protein
MRRVLTPAHATFSAVNRTISFATTVPASISHILKVTNLTRGVVLFDPTAESGDGYLSSATYASPVLTLVVSTAGMADSDRLFIEYDDGQGGGGGGGGGGDATAANQALQLAELESIDSKLPALSGGAVPVLSTASATDSFGNNTRAYDTASSLRQAFTSTSSAAVALPTLGASREVMFHASSAGRCFIRFGASDVIAASVAAGQLALEAGERFHMRIPAGVTHFRVIRDTTDGHLNVTAVL